MRGATNKMSIIRKVEPEANHHCSPPYTPRPETLYGAGTIWECDTCKRRYVLVSNPDPRDDQREPRFIWMPQ